MFKASIYDRRKSWNLCGLNAYRSMILLLLLLWGAQVFGQQRRITGKVSNSAGEAMPGVTISVKGSTVGTSTNEQGLYGIDVSDDQTVLIFTFLGFKLQEVTVGTREVIPVTMVADPNVLDGVVVVGYGTQKRSDLTGSVASVNMHDFSKAPVPSFDQALAGRVSGVQVVSTTGQPGNAANIVIRGAGSITQDNSPLYVVDGFPLEESNANSINPSDIESIDILKDASATAIYGARGANGVVLITTKTGQTGVPSITYNGYYGTQALQKRMELMSAHDFVAYSLDLDEVLGRGMYLEDGVTLEDYHDVSSLDFQDYVFRTGQNQNHDIAIRGGNELTKYAISGNFNDQQGVIINSGFKRYQGRLNLDQTINKRLKVGLNVNYSYSGSSGQQISESTYYASSALLYSVWGWRPTRGIFPGQPYPSEEELLNTLYDDAIDGSGAVQDYRVNPYINLNNQYTLIKDNFLRANGYAEYKFGKRITFRTSGGITSNTRGVDIFNNSLTQSGSKYNRTGPNGSVSTTPVINWLHENVLTYRNRFANSHNLTAILGNSIQQENRTLRMFGATQVTNEALGLDALDLTSPENRTISSSSSIWTLASFFSRVNYDYKGRYLLTATMRADGSSKFAPTNRWGYFPSASFAWRFKDESFIKKWDVFSDGKLRAGYGASGNNRVADFAYLGQLSLDRITYWYSKNNTNPEIGAVLTAGGNDNLKWETSNQYNIGLDLGFLKQRITMTADVYKKVTNDLLLNTTLPYAIGVENSLGYKNVGKIQNTGLEISLNTINVDKKDFSWNTNFNISFNKNKILKLTDDQTTLLAGSGYFFNTTYSTLSPYISYIGGSLGDMYGLIFDGVYQYDDFEGVNANGTYQLKADVAGYGSSRSATPGDIKYKDINGDYIIDNRDFTVIGRGIPIHTGGITNNFRYKNIDLNILLQWSYGNDKINANRMVFEGGIVTNPYLNQFASYNDRWTPTNPSNTLFRAGGMPNANYSSRVIEDGSYLRLKTVSLGYTFGDRFLQKAKLNTLRVHCSAQNLFTWTNYSGMDPESSTRHTNLTPNFDYAGYPQAISFVFGVSTSF